MTDGLNVVSTDIWRVLLPADWTQEEQTGRATVCFKSEDESKGAYFLAWTIDEARARFVPEERCRADFEELHAMKNGVWKIVAEWRADVAPKFSKGIDCLNEEAFYRITCLTLARGPWAIRATFHDYYCVSYPESKEWFEPLVRSFEFTDKEA